MALYLLMFFEVTCLLGRRKMLRFVYVEDEKYFQKEVKTIIIQHYIEKGKKKKIIRKLQAHAIIIFITSHLEFALKGYDYAAFQFIDKQKIKEKIPEVLTCVDEKLALQNKNYYIISTNSRYIKIPLEDIIYIYKEAKNCIFVCKNDDTIIISRNYSLKVKEEIHNYWRKHIH